MTVICQYLDTGARLPLCRKAGVGHASLPCGECQGDWEPERICLAIPSLFIHHPPLQMAASLTHAVVDWVGAGCGLVDDAELERRRGACPECWFSGRCPACGCFSGAKFRMAGQRCPLGRW